MPGDVLLWDSQKRRLDRAWLADRPPAAPHALVLHRRLQPSFGRACAEVGAELLPPVLRHRFPEGACLVWLPIVPSRCLLVTTSGAGFRQVERPQPDAELSSLLEQLEVESAWVFEEELRAEPDARASEEHLDAALALTLGVLDHIMLQHERSHGTKGGVS